MQTAYLHSNAQVAVRLNPNGSAYVLSCKLLNLRPGGWGCTSRSARRITLLIRLTPPVSLSAFHSGVKQSPYKSMFGMYLRVGLSTSSLPSEILKDINDEEDLTKVINNELQVKRLMIA
ncbi:hypothetical protein J6590_001024 [Homalodisca vitripennis]|nr:hypothetical protein J6590_001024 [Homalodisca vitripennis]